MMMLILAFYKNIVIIKKWLFNKIFLNYLFFCLKFENIQIKKDAHSCFTFVKKSPTPCVFYSKHLIPQKTFTQTQDIYKYDTQAVRRTAYLTKWESTIITPHPSLLILALPLLDQCAWIHHERRFVSKIIIMFL